MSRFQPVMTQETITPIHRNQALVALSLLRLNAAVAPASPITGVTATTTINICCLTSLSLIHICGGELFEPKTELHSYMQDASGLIEKAAVQLNGIQIGKISQIGLSGINDPKKVVWIEMKVKSRYLPAIPVDSTVAITADDLLGDKYLNISSGKSTQAVQPGAELHSILPIGDQFNSSDLVAAMKDMLNRVDATIAQLEDPRAPLGSFIQTEDFYNQVRQEIMSVQDAISTVLHPKSDLGKMVYTDEFYNHIAAPIIAIDKSLVALQAGEGQAGHLLENSEDYEKYHQDLSDIRQSLADINAGKGTMGQLTQSDATYRQIQRLVRTLGDMVDEVNAGEGRLGVYLADSQLYESLAGSTKEMQNLIGDFRTNPRKYLRLKVF